MSVREAGHQPDTLKRMLQQGAHREVFAYLRPLAAQRSADPQVAYLYGVAAYRVGELDEARQGFQEVLRLEPAAAKAHQGLGLVAEAQGDAHSAIEHYRTAVQLQPQLTEARTALARLNAAAPPQPAPAPSTAAPARPAPAPASTGPAAEPRSRPAPALTPVPIATSSPAASPRPIRAMINPATRVLKGFLLAVLLLPLAFSAMLVATSAWALATQDENSDLDEAQLFGMLAFGGLLLTLALMRGVRRIGVVHVRGYLSGPSLRPVPSRNPRAPSTTQILSFALITTDSRRHAFPSVPVELRTKKYHQGLAHGDEVIVSGYPCRQGYLQARSVRSVSTGLTIKR